MFGKPARFRKSYISKANISLTKLQRLVDELLDVEAGRVFQTCFQPYRISKSMC